MHGRWTITISFGRTRQTRATQIARAEAELDLMTKIQAGVLLNYWAIKKLIIY
jgi:hypothetical protein